MALGKDAYYFPHFCNARGDRKVKRVMKELGVEGYGIFFMVLETLREQPEMEYPVEDIDLLADEFKTSDQKVHAVICNYGLFETTQDGMFFSPKLNEYMQPYFDTKEKKRLAGIKSGESRRLSAMNKCGQGMIEHTSNTVQTKTNKGEEKRREESKPDNKQYLPIAELLKNVVLLRRERNISSKMLTTWSNTIRLLIERDNVPVDEVIQVINWYRDNWNGDYIPVIESAKALREKYQKLLNAIKRHSPQSIKSSPNCEKCLYNTDRVCSNIGKDGFDVSKCKSYTEV